MSASRSDPPARRAPAPAVREEILEPLRRVLGWLLSQRDGRGRIVCPEHRVEHTGKSAGAIVLALELSRLDPRADVAELKGAAVEQGRRLVANLVREGTSPCHTFRPGRHDPFNCSNSVIDGGACSDALGALVRELGDELAPADRDAFRDASLLHARTYLRYAVLDKGVPAQRAWGLTGLASAWTLEQDPLLETAALEAVKLLEEIQHSDGSYPYHPLEWGAPHVGAGDVSAYYTSRVTGFLLHALEDLGRDPAEEGFRGALRRGLDFLVALHGPDGIKSGLVEAKPWYWGATYEVASHPFDVHALASGWRVFGEERYAEAAVRAFRSWAAHLEESGAPRSHSPGPGRGRSYQCPTFWAGHAMWLARAAVDLEAALARPEREASSPLEPVRYFADASLVRLENERLVAWVRGARPGFNASHGSPHGAGLLGVVRKTDGASLLERCRLGGHQAGEWSGKAGRFSLARGWRAGSQEVRFSWWLARVHWRAGRRLEALKTPPAMIRRAVLAFAHPRVSSAFTTLDVEVLVLEDGVRLRAPLSRRDGTALPGTAIERVFRVDEGGLAVHERLLRAPGVRELDYVIPPLAEGIEREGNELRYRLR